MISCEINEKELKKNYEKALEDDRFKRLIKKVDVSNDIAMRYTSSLENTVTELSNCSKCKGLLQCQNRLEGHVLWPDKYGKQLIFSYIPCKYQKEKIKKEQNRNCRDKDLASASFASIDLSDKKRAHVIKFLKEFADNYEINGNIKGLYLHGNFGCGKTYLICALFHELEKKRISTEVVYYPELLRDIKNDFSDFGDRIAYLEEVDLLLIDDIGAEKVTEWSRDEVLGTILQKRMNNYKTTFFTSNLDMEALTEHLRINSNSDDEMKARRILERIKQLTIDMELISENKRK